jgi:hypothetical protein
MQSPDFLEHLHHNAALGKRKDAEDHLLRALIDWRVTSLCGHLGLLGPTGDPFVGGQRTRISFMIHQPGDESLEQLSAQITQHTAI